MSPRQISRSIDEKLRLAIAEKRLVRIRYSASERVIAPHDHGIMNTTTMLLAYQPRSSGASKSPAVGWRLFEVEKIEQLSVLAASFPGSRGVSHQKHHAWTVLYVRVT